MSKMALFEQKDFLLFIRTLVHDTDKLFLYAFTNVPFEFIRIYHSKRKHHSHVRTMSTLDRKEKILDWESSSRSKADKPMTAIEFLYYVKNRYSEVEFTIMENLIKKMGY